MKNIAKDEILTIIFEYNFATNLVFTIYEKDYFSITKT